MKWLVTIVWVLAYSSAAKAQFRALNYGVPGTTYYQNFDSLPMAGTFSLPGRGPHHFQGTPFLPPRLVGWFFLQQAGTGTQANFYVGSGTSTSHGMVSTGQTNNPDRSLGSLSTSTASYAFGVIFINQTNKILNTIDFTANIEQWRKGGSGQKNNWLFRMKTGVWQGIDTSGGIPLSAGNFSSLHSTPGSASLNGNLIENQQKLTLRQEGLIWKPGEQLMLCWFDPDDPGNDDLCSLDDFSFKADRLVRLPQIDSLRLDSIQPGSFLIRTNINPNGSETQLQWQCDTLPSFSTNLPFAATPTLLTAATEFRSVTGQLSGLLPGKQYYIRLIAGNEAGSVTSETISILTPELPPQIKIIDHLITKRNEATITGIIEKKNRLPIKSIRIQWSTLSDFSQSSITTSPPPASDTFQITISGIPTGSSIYLRGLLQQNDNVSAGEIYSINTPVYIDYFSLRSAPFSSDSTIYFELALTNEIPEFFINHFSLVTRGVQDASIQSIQKKQNKALVSVHTGLGDGCIGLKLINSPTNTVVIDGLPKQATGTACLDKSPPAIKKIIYPNKAFKSGDTLIIEIHINPDTGRVQLLQGSWAGIGLNHWHRLNDSIYTSTLVIPSGSIEIAPSETILCILKLADELGNRTNEIGMKIEQDKDGVDTKAPSVERCVENAAGSYAIGDTLRWEFQFSEKIICTTDRKPYLWINIGGHNRQATFRRSDSSMLVFEYIIKTGDWDNQGITWRNNITLNGARINDLAGNSALLNFIPNSVIITVDGIAPFIKRMHRPQPFLYKMGEELSFTVDFSEPIRFWGNEATAALQIQTESKMVLARLTRATDTSLQFAYTIQEGVWDKKGIKPMRILIGAGNMLTDIAGNLAALNFEQFNTDSKIFIDATAPRFLTPGDTSLLLCASDTILDLQRLLDFIDPEPLEKITLQPILFSENNSSKLPSLFYSSTGAVILPYLRIPLISKKEARKDTIQILLSDSVHVVSKKIIIEYIPLIERNFLHTPTIHCSASKPLPIKADFPTGGNGSYQFQWESASTPAAVFRNSGGNDTIPEYAPMAITDSIYFRRKVRSGPCSDISGVILFPVMGKGLWVGNISSDWNLAGNWCGQQIPLKDMNVLIPGGVPFSPVISGVAYAGRLELQEGGSLLLKGILQLSGNIHVRPGLVQAEDGVLILSGEERQTVSGRNFRNQELGELYVRNKKGVELIDTLCLKRKLTIQSGDVTIVDQLRLKKNAIIGPSAEGSMIRGLVEINYEVLGRKRQYQFTAHPFLHTIALDQLNEQIDITGNRTVDTNFAATPLQLPSAFKLISCETDSCLQQLKWRPFNSLNGMGLDGWNPYEGIRWLFRGKKGEGLDDETDWLQSKSNRDLPKITIPLKGEVNTGDQTIVFPDSSVGFRLLGNPFVSPIYPMAIQLSDSIAPVYWKWNPNQGSSGGFTCSEFRNWDTLSAFGSFIVQLRGKKNTHRIVIPERAKFGSNLISPANIESEVQQQLVVEWWQDSIFLDRVIVKDNKKAGADYDTWDGIKINNPSHNLFVTTFSGYRVSYNQRYFDAKSKFNLGAVDAKPGNYQLRFQRNHWKEEYGWQLHDRYAGKWWPLNKDTIITFQINNDSMSHASDRFIIGSPWLLTYDSSRNFKLRLRLWPVPAKDILYAASIRWPTTKVWVYIYDSSGQLIKSFTAPAPTKSELEINVSEIPPGVHEILISSPDQKFQALGRWIKQK